MDRFHIIDDAAAVLVTKSGVYRQAKVYRRGRELFAGHGGGFVRLYRNGTSVPSIRCDAIELPAGAIDYDAHGRATVTP